MLEKALVAMLSACAGGVFTWSMHAVQLDARVDGRLGAIEAAIIRIEKRLEAPR